MADSSNKNPIEQRIDYLAGLWNQFAKDPEPRLLRWLVDDDGRRLVELLIDMQNEEVGDLPDLFIRFEKQFTNARSYPLELLESLKQQYAESGEEMAAANLPTDWKCPWTQTQEDGLRVFLKAGTSLKAYYREKMLSLVLVLTPTAINDNRQWCNFLIQLVEMRLPQTMRITVIDHVDRPMLDPLCEAAPELVRTVTPDLDIPGALEEIAETAKGVGPGHEFRKLFVRLSNVAATGNVKAGHKIATNALRIAGKQKWYDLQMAVYMVLGAMHLGNKDTDTALKSYQYAGKAADAAQASGNPSGGKLIIQSRFAQAGVLIAKRDYRTAAPLYESMAPLAKSEDETFLEMESWRMAAYCYEMDSAYEKAWQCGHHALDTGAHLDKDLRPNSTLPYVGQRLLELARKNNRRPHEGHSVQERMESLVGKNWEEKLEVGETAS